MCIYTRAQLVYINLQKISGYIIILHYAESRVGSSERAARINHSFPAVYLVPCMQLAINTRLDHSGGGGD
jgi:hypothetical protein